MKIVNFLRVPVYLAVLVFLAHASNVDETPDSSLASSETSDGSFVPGLRQRSSDMSPIPLSRQRQRQMTVLLPRDGNQFKVRRQKAELEEDLLSAGRPVVILMGYNSIVTEQNSTEVGITKFGNGFAATMDTAAGPILLFEQMDSRPSARSMKVADPNGELNDSN